MSLIVNMRAHLGSSFLIGRRIAQARLENHRAVLRHVARADAQAQA
jgi:hypothetical protein